ncbi:hypothetical protein ACO0K0_02375 [Undibacterium sp. SXout11W]|uniref:hypothetical protein n=1 Tax=Undibacterium sp. SXout11W TaxID=3413050 RepID=UPI003BEFECB4
MYLGINKSIEVDATGAISGFHRITWYSVDLTSKTMTLTVSGYVSADAFNAGKQAMLSTNVTLQAVPGDTDLPLDFAYKAITASAPVPAAPDPAHPMMPAVSNVFAGATLVPVPAPAPAPSPAPAPAAPGK